MESGCYLCDDLLRDILLRLPTKSLLRFKTISKQWNSSITDPCFLNKTPKFIIENGYNDKAFFSLDPCSSGNLEKLSLPADLDIKTSNLILEGSCNGLLLLRAFGDTRMWIANVLTQEFHTIHIPNFGSFQSTMYIEHKCFGFGYDFVNDDYKVIKVFSYRESHNEPIQGTSVYSLRNNAWRTNRARKGLGALVAFQTASSVLVGGKLHWISKPDHKGEHCILAFDLSSEEFLEIAALPKAEDVNSHFGFLSELDGCVTVTELSRNPPFPATIWVLKESSWVQVLKICDFVSKTRNMKYRPVAPLTYSKTGNEVLMTDFYSCFWYNKENGNACGYIILWW